MTVFDIQQFASGREAHLKEAAHIIARIARLYKECGREKELLYILEEEGIQLNKSIRLSDICIFTLMGTTKTGEFIKITESKNIIESEEKLEVNFTKTEVRLSNQEPFNKKYPSILLENIILQGKVHWLWGFVSLDRWISGKVGKTIGNPRFQFGNYISKDINKFREFGFDIKCQRGGDEWYINYETTKSKIKCNLLEARNDYEEALIEFEKGNLNKAIEKLELAISPVFYSDVKFIVAYNLLIRCIFKANYKNISESLLSKVKDFLWWYETKLKAAVFFIRKVYIKKGILAEEEISKELSKIESELEETQKSYEAIKKRITVPEKDKDFQDIVRIVQDLREVINEEVIINERLPEDTFETEEFMALKNNKKIKEIFKLNFDDLRRLKPYLNDKDGTEDFLLFQIIAKGINFNKHSNLVSIQKLLNQRLKDEIKQLT